MLTLLQDTIPTPIGELFLLCDETFQLRAVEWTEHASRLTRLFQRQYAGQTLSRRMVNNPGGLSEKLQQYFDGDLTVLHHLPVAPVGTPFQKQVWQALTTIPCGTVLSYGELAAKVGRPSAARAVGAANGANPVSLVIPCHRVIGHNGALTGYAGGVQRKKWLLAHEGYIS